MQSTQIATLPVFYKFHLNPLVMRKGERVCSLRSDGTEVPTRLKGVGASTDSYVLKFLYVHDLPVTLTSSDSGPGTVLSTPSQMSMSPIPLQRGPCLRGGGGGLTEADVSDAWSVTRSSKYDGRRVRQVVQIVYFFCSVSFYFSERVQGVHD